MATSQTFLNSLDKDDYNKWYEYFVIFVYSNV